MGFKITSLAAAVFATTSRDPITVSLHAGMVDRRFMLGRWGTEGGALGFGQAAAMPFVTGETFCTKLPVLAAKIALLLKGGNFRDKQGVHCRWEQPLAVRNPSAVSAVDMAAHDALGKVLCVPMDLHRGRLLSRCGQPPRHPLWGPIRLFSIRTPFLSSETAGPRSPKPPGWSRCWKTASVPVKNTCDLPWNETCILPSNVANVTNPNGIERI